MPTELEHGPGAPKLEYNRERRDLLISLSGIVGGACIAAIGLDGSNRSMDEGREFALGLAQARINSKESGVTMEALNMEYARKTFMRDRGYPGLLFLGVFIVFMGGARLYVR